MADNEGFSVPQKTTIGDTRQLGARPALIDGPSERTITYAQLPDLVARVAAGLAQRGFHKGDRFAIFSSNLPEYAIAFHLAAVCRTHDLRSTVIHKGCIGSTNFQTPSRLELIRRRINRSTPQRPQRGC